MVRDERVVKNVAVIYSRPEDGLARPKADDLSQGKGYLEVSYRSLKLRLVLAR